MYQFKEAIDYRGHFWFDKKTIENMNWAMLPPASKTIFPVIAAHQDKNGVAFPGEQTISILSGRTDKIVRRGIEGLRDFPGIEIQNYVTPRGRRSKKFKIAKPPEISGRSFPFFKSVFEGGNWQEITPTAQALYPVMRCFGFFDSLVFQLYLSLEEGEEHDLLDFDDVFKTREWDFCSAELDVLAGRAGITKKSVRKALESLEETNLIKPFKDEDLNGWMVFLRPKMRYKRAYLNKKIMDKYRHLETC